METAQENKPSPSSPPLDVLVSGSGIAGPCFAFWLHKLLPDTRITVLERAPAPRLGGQAIDLRSSSVPIVERMGLLSKVKEKTTTEAGIEFVYMDGKRKATFPASGDVEKQSMTSEFEILRGDMAEILYNATKDLPNIQYIFDEMITSIQQHDSSSSSSSSSSNNNNNSQVEVTFANRLPPSKYDLVVGADGQTSRTRRLVFGHGPNQDDYIHRLGQYAALFTMPRVESDTRYAQWYNSTKGRLFLLRPDQYGTTRAYLSVTDANLARFEDIEKALREGDREAQQQWFEREFRDVGWQAERCLTEMRRAEDYYVQQVAQVKMETWVEGRVVLLGDAAYCPSPISGVGTSAAIVGSYILAGELSKSPHDIPAALLAYEATARPYIEQAQKLFPGAPQIANPQTEMGVKFFNAVIGVVAHPWTRGLGGLMGRWMPAFGSTTAWKPPVYQGVER